jgi:hypothetical protein
MAHPSTSNWLLDPAIPAPPALPQLDGDAAEADPSAARRSGTWRVGTRPEYEDDDADSERFATADAEAPTVRPGALRALKTR